MLPRYSNLTQEERDLIYKKLDKVDGMPKKCPWCGLSNLNVGKYDPDSCSEFICLDCGLHVCVTCYNIYG